LDVSIDALPIIIALETKEDLPLIDQDLSMIYREVFTTSESTLASFLENLTHHTN
jgi:hypothetical protein